MTGATSNKRPDRAGHFRSGGFVRGRSMRVEREDASESAADEKAEKYKDGGKLTMGQRKAMPSRRLRFPAKGRTKRKGLWFLSDQ